MKTNALALICAAAAAPALAGEIQQNVLFSYDAIIEAASPVFDLFDTQGGTRELTGVRFDFNHRFEHNVRIESTGPTAISAGDYQADLGFISIFQLGTVNQEEIPAEEGEAGNEPPFFGPGASFTPFYSEAHQAYSGVPGENVFRDTFVESYSNSWNYDTSMQSVLDAVTGVGQLETVLGGFGEINFQWINEPGWPPAPGFFPTYPDTAAVWVGWESLIHSGDFTVTYTYQLVPAPAAAGLLAGFGLIARRRRC